MKSLNICLMRMAQLKMVKELRANRGIRKTIIAVFVYMMVITGGNAQQDPLYNSALINPLLENPAMAGFNKYSQCFLHYQKQWLDIEGAPESAMLSVDWPLKDEKSGLAVVVSSDRANILGHVGFMAAYSHDVKINDEQHLRLGLGLKLNHNTIYFDRVKAENTSESTLFNYVETATGFNSNFGLSYSYKKLRAGLSVKNLVNSRLLYRNETDEKNLYFQYIPQYYLNLQYTYDITEDIWVRPEVAARGLQGMPTQIEAGVLATYQDKYSAGLVFRNKNSFGILMSMLIYERLTVSYSYKAAMGEISGYNGGSHEVTLGYRFFTSHFQGYKSADAEKLDELIAFSQKQVEDNKELKQSNQDLKEEQKRLSEELKKEKEEIARLKEILKAERERFNSAREEDEIELDELPEDLIKDPSEPIYVILGVFSDNYQAKKFQHILKREHGLTTVVLKRRDKQDYIVCVNRKYDSKKALSKELKRYKNISRFYSDNDAWIYVIQ